MAPKIPTLGTSALSDPLPWSMFRNYHYDQRVITVIMLAYVTLHLNKPGWNVSCWPQRCNLHEFHSCKEINFTKNQVSLEEDLEPQIRPQTQLTP